MLHGWKEVRTFGGYSFLLLPCGVLVPPLFTEPAIWIALSVVCTLCDLNLMTLLP